MSDLKDSPSLKNIDGEEFQLFAEEVFTQTDFYPENPKQLFDAYSHLRNQLFSFVLNENEDATADLDKGIWLAEELKKIGIIHENYAENLKLSLTIFNSPKDSREYLWDALKQLDKSTKPQARNDGWKYVDKFLAATLALMLCSQDVPRRSSLYIASKAFKISTTTVENLFKQIDKYFLENDVPEREAISRILLGITFFRIWEKEINIMQIPPRAKHARSENDLTQHLEIYSKLRWSLGWGYHKAILSDLKSPSPLLNGLLSKDEIAHLVELEGKEDQGYLNELYLSFFLIYKGMQDIFPGMMIVNFSKYLPQNQQKNSK